MRNKSKLNKILRCVKHILTCGTIILFVSCGQTVKTEISTNPEAEFFGENSTSNAEIDNLVDVTRTNVVNQVSEREQSRVSSSNNQDSAINSRVSDEQDFVAVADRETIESDAIRRQEQQAIRVVYAPQSLPQRIGIANVAEFALKANNAVGEKIYNRYTILYSERETRTKCANYTSDYAAQQAFLDYGGPDQDRLKLDPDGDGFACGWTPDIFQNMIK